MIRLCSRGLNIKAGNFVSETCGGEVGGLGVGLNIKMFYFVKDLIHPCSSAVNIRQSHGIEQCFCLRY